VTRPRWNSYFMNVAKAVSERADCKRAKYGAVLVKDKRIVACGYNGPPPGEISCLGGGCPRGNLTKEELPPNFANYENCVALHAEQNCIAYSNRDDCVGATMYLWGGMPPCDMCRKLLRAAGVATVVYQDSDGRMKSKLV